MHPKPLSGDSPDQILKRVRSLERRAERDAQQAFWLEGVRNFVQAYDARYSFDAVIYSPVLLKSVVADMLLRRLRAAATRVARVSPEQFRSVSSAGRASGIGAIARQQWSPLSRADAARGLCWLVIEQIRSPGNLGTILRTAEACGVGGIIFVGPAGDPFDPAVVRASMGGIFHLPFTRAAHAQVRHWAHARGVQIVGLSPQADRLWTDLPADRPLAIMVGEERGGLSESQRSICQLSVRLPMTGRADSLNVSIATGVMLYELVRRGPMPA